MNKKLIRLTESDIHRIVKESVEKIISEIVLRHRPTPEELENPKIPKSQRRQNGHIPGRLEKWVENHRKTYTDPGYFAHLLRTNCNFKDGLKDWGV